MILFVQYMLVAALIIGGAGFCDAGGFFAFDDMEKPKPEFNRRGEEISAKLIPRAKSTRTVINFRVADGGQLVDVKGVDFQTVDRPEVDVKNFKSAAFEIRIDNVKPGGEARVSMDSDFFAASTAFYVFNPKLEKPWMTPQIVNISRQESIRELVVTVRDGSPLDADGAVDGRIILIGGPRDSFWGYALGTLFIRFFGIFIVLSILMLGMILSGLYFKFNERTQKSENESLGNISGPEKKETGDELPGQSSEATEEEAAVIAAALYLHFKQTSVQTDRVSAQKDEGAWALGGRQRIMNDRLSVFNRLNR